ncbi:MAG: hypothetical protein JWQ72_217, partial [Polaromonas sp.]|nr:hypothetical protein [Polaromonas sp.]
MNRARTWLVGTAAAVGLLAVAIAVAVSLIPSDEELAAKAASGLQDALGARVTIGALHWHLLPVPRVDIEDAVVHQPQPITLKRLLVYPDTSALWRRVVRIKRAELDGAVVPQVSLRGLGKNAAAGAAPGGFSLDPVPLERFEFRDVTWRSRTNIPVIYSGEVDFDAGWRPREATVRRPAFAPVTDMVLTRQGQEDRWSVRINVGGGTLNGAVQLQTAPSGRMHLSGQLQPRGIEVSSALEAFNRRPALAGKATGETTLSADGDTVLVLAQSLHTTTPFVMGRSTLLRFDLDKAIRTIGKEHSGQTTLESIKGILETQNQPDGMVVYFKQVEAKSGALSASGQARLLNRHIDAEFAVDLVNGVVGVPFKVTGPVNNVSVSMPAGAVAGAVVGTAVLPGVGTAIGARIGATIGKIFGSGPDTKKSPATDSKAGGQRGS